MIHSIPKTIANFLVSLLTTPVESSNNEYTNDLDQPLDPESPEYFQKEIENMSNYPERYDME